MAVERNDVTRSRVVYAILAANVIVLGMASRQHGAGIPVVIAEYAGDTLWALLVFILIGLLFPSWPTWRVAAIALLFSFAIEISQLYRAPWIDAIRRTTPGGLVLGFGFLWSDLLCYMVGIGIGVIGEMIYSRMRRAVLRA